MPALFCLHVLQRCNFSSTNSMVSPFVHLHIYLAMIALFLKCPSSLTYSNVQCTYLLIILNNYHDFGVLFLRPTRLIKNRLVDLSSSNRTFILISNNSLTSHQYPQVTLKVKQCHFTSFRAYRNREISVCGRTDRALFS